MEIKKTILRIIPYISEKTEQRQRLQERDCFFILISIFFDSIIADDQDFLFLSVTSLSHFTNDSHSRNIIANSNKTHETYRILSRCIDHTNLAPSSCRIASASIVLNLIKNDVSLL